MEKGNGFQPYTMELDQTEGNHSVFLNPLSVLLPGIQDVPKDTCDKKIHNNVN